MQHGKGGLVVCAGLPVFWFVAEIHAHTCYFFIPSFLAALFSLFFPRRAHLSSSILLHRQL
jgi:hypothetical protein